MHSDDFLKLSPTKNQLSTPLTTPETTQNVYTRTLLRVVVLAQRPGICALSSTTTPSVTSSSIEYFGSLKLLAVTGIDRLFIATTS